MAAAIQLAELERSPPGNDLFLAVEGSGDNGGRLKEISLPAEWKAIFDEAVSDAERELIRALAEAGAAVPALGYETDDGEVIDMAWAGGKVGVSFDGEVAAADGWTFCAADVPQILAALKSNGVM